jgi:hydroxyacylglutathione hydrolase
VDDAEPAVLTAVDAERAVRSGAIVIDGRSPDRFDAGHVPGSLNVPLQGRAVGTRAAAMLGADLELVLVADAYRDAVVLAGLLVSAGLTRIVGTLAGGIAQRRSVPLPVDRVSAADVETARTELDAGLATLLDVREAEEVYADPLPGALCVPLADVPFLRHRDLPEGPILVACQTGNRAALAASVLRRNGVGNVRRVSGGGVPELKAALPVLG